MDCLLCHRLSYAELQVRDADRRCLEKFREFGDDRGQNDDCY